MVSTAPNTTTRIMGAARNSAAGGGRAHHMESMRFPTVVSRPNTPVLDAPSWRASSGAGRVLGAEEKAALMAGRPDLLNPAPATPGRMRPRSGAWR